MKFCEYCSNCCQILIEKDKSEKKLLYKCKVCDHKFKNEDTIIYSTNGNIIPDFNFNINIIYDITLPRIMKDCEKCKMETEHLVTQTNPDNYKCYMICTKCVEN
jgi:hypothetical protein